jgi:hypothetical protein
MDGEREHRKMTSFGDRGERAVLSGDVPFSAKDHSHHNGR